MNIKKINNIKNDTLHSSKEYFEIKSKMFKHFENQSSEEQMSFLSFLKRQCKDLFSKFGKNKKFHFSNRKRFTFVY